MKVEILENSPHYCKVYDNDGNFICFAGKYGEPIYKEKCKKALEEYPYKENNFYKNLLKFYEKNGALSNKQLACLEKELVKKDDS